MNFEKNDRWVLESISPNSGVYEILHAGYEHRKQLIPYEDLDQGLNRLITNQLVVLKKKRYDLTSKGVELLQRMVANSPGFEAGLDWPSDIEMQKAPNLLRYFVFPNEYNDALFRLVEFLGEGQIQIGRPEKKPKGLKPSASRRRMETLISEKGISICHFDLAELCMALRESMNEKFDCEDDDLLYEVGVFASGGCDVFSLIFTRQFSVFDKNDQYDHMEQLSIKLDFQNNVSLSSLRDEIWSTDFPSIDDFFSYVKKTPSYQETNRLGKIINISITFGGV